MVGAVVIGGGVVGASTAYHLASAGTETVLLDRSDPGRATAAGAGVVSPESSRHADPDWYDLAVPAAAYYPRLVEELERYGPTGYARTGTLVVAVDADEREAYATARDRVFRRQAERGHPSEQALDELDPSAAVERFPPLADVEAAFFYEGGARVDGRALTDRLIEAGEDAELVSRTADVTGLELTGGRVTAVETEAGERFETAAAVIAGGAWSGEFADQLDLTLPVEPQRGQLVHLRVDEAPPGDWPTVTAFHGHYIVPRTGGRIIAGATREDGTGFDARATAAGLREVLDEALRVAPGLADAAFEAVRVGLRPVTADGLPVIGAVPGVEGVYVATGHGPTGLTLGPYTGRLVARLVRGAPVEHDLGPFDPGRF